jgi:hypothetical protein
MNDNEDEGLLFINDAERLIEGKETSLSELNTFIEACENIHSASLHYYLSLLKNKRSLMRRTITNQRIQLMMLDVVKCNDLQSLITAMYQDKFYFRNYIDDVQLRWVKVWLKELGASSNVSIRVKRVSLACVMVKLIDKRDKCNQLVQLLLNNFNTKMEAEVQWPLTNPPTKSLINAVKTVYMNSIDLFKYYQ